MGAVIPQWERDPDVPRRLAVVLENGEMRDSAQNSAQPLVFNQIHQTNKMNNRRQPTMTLRGEKSNAKLIQTKKL